MFFIELTDKTTGKIISIRIDMLVALVEAVEATTIFIDGSDDPFTVSETYTEIMDLMAEINELAMGKGS